MKNRRAIVIGGGTTFHIRPHLALCAPAYGSVARRITDLMRHHYPQIVTELLLTRMAGGEETDYPPRPLIDTNADLAAVISDIVDDVETKIIFMSAAVCDFDASVFDDSGQPTLSGKDQPRLHTSENGKSVNYILGLTPAEKIIGSIRSKRKDIFLVGFKTTAGATEQEMYLAGLKLCKQASCNLVLANDVQTRLNMVITPEEARYHVTTNRDEAIRGLVEMTYLRSQLTFTRSTVVAGDPVPWGSELVPAALRKVVDHCINNKAYKPFGGATVGHFACKVGKNTFLTSRRKTDFNKLAEVGLVRIETDGPDSVIAYGSKPSVGGQSQRIVFHDHEEYDCIVHFHCPKRPESQVPTVSQREYECGSHECGRNTSAGLKRFGNLSAVYLDQHGPNIVFHSSIDPAEVIQFIEDNFDLSAKTGGLVS